MAALQGTVCGRRSRRAGEGGRATGERCEASVTARESTDGASDLPRAVTWASGEGAHESDENCAESGPFLLSNRRNLACVGVCNAGCQGYFLLWHRFDSEVKKIMWKVKLGEITHSFLSTRIFSVPPCCAGSRTSHGLAERSNQICSPYSPYFCLRLAHLHARR
jgi:hypothetical protein